MAFLAGCLYTIVGILKLGWLTNFLSHSVISGFMSGASVIIALSQVEGAFLSLTSRYTQSIPDTSLAPIASLPVLGGNADAHCTSASLDRVKPACTAQHLAQRHANR